MNLIIIISSITLLFYLIQISLYIYGFLKLELYVIQKDKFKFEKKKNITVIIPFKNEIKNLSKLLNSLSEQTTDSELFEVIFVNDNSTDHSEEIIRSEIKKKKNYKIYHTNNTIKGKKNAIKLGISKAQTNIIVSTDADCIHHPKWLETILSYYIEKKPKMIIAPVIITGNRFFEQMQSLEFLSLIASTAGATGTKHPIMCNGANLAYEKNAYYEFEDALNMKEESGDDVFFLHNIKKKYPKEIHYLKSKDAVVYTEAENSFKSFYKQRSRWASKTRSYKDFDTIVSSFIVFSTNLLLITLYILSIFDIEMLNAALILTLFKTIPDLILLIISAKFFKLNKLLVYFPAVFLVYPFYIVITAISGLFAKNVYWK